MYNNKRSKEAEKRRDELYKQKQCARTFIFDYEFKDQVTSEEVNLLEKDEIHDHLKTTFTDYYVGAVPDVIRAQVLEIPNVYHLELFRGCQGGSICAGL
jgi:hypothetical protein